MRFIFTAKDNGALAATHVDGDQFEFVVGARQFTRQQRIRKKVVRAVDGTERHQLENIERLWNVTTARIQAGTQQDEFLSMVDSVSAGELFTWDRNSTSPGASVTPLIVLLNSTSIREQRIMRTNYFRYSLTLKQA